MGSPIFTPFFGEITLPETNSSNLKMDGYVTFRGRVPSFLLLLLMGGGLTPLDSETHWKFIY